jgi:signal transduction histidine kinase
MPISVNISGFLGEYFNTSGQEVFLKKGDVLMDYGDPNYRLYVLIKGRLTASFPDEEGDFYELFPITLGMYVGVYSFFSRSFKSASKMQAAEDCHLAFIEHSALQFDNPTKAKKALEDAIQIIVGELFQRQKLAHLVSTENRNTLKRLLQADKMATLGQMAAGLAHELNNAIMVIDRNTHWIEQQLTDFVTTKSNKFISDFEKGKTEGSQLPTEEVRKKAELLEAQLKIKRNLAKKLAKTGYENEKLNALTADELLSVYQYWELGAVLFDMKLAAKHAMHVVKSVKQLGANRSDRTAGIQINDSIKEAMGILASQLRAVNVVTDLQPLPTVYGNSGEFVQIWINIIKNSCEALISSKTPQPKILVKTSVHKKQIKIELTDNGPGIPTEIIPQIYKPSFTTKIDGLSFGLGLGLSIVERLVDSYEGKIKLATKPGSTTFTILIPYDHGND